MKIKHDFLDEDSEYLVAGVFNQSSQWGVENHIIFSQPAQGLSLLNMWQHRAVLKATV